MNDFLFANDGAPDVDDNVAVIKRDLHMKQHAAEGFTYCGSTITIKEDASVAEQSRQSHAAASLTLVDFHGEPERLLKRKELSE